jgi:hypothetical protein
LAPKDLGTPRLHGSFARQRAPDSGGQHKLGRAHQPETILGRKHPHLKWREGEAQGWPCSLRIQCPRRRSEFAKLSLVGP